MPGNAFSFANLPKKNVFVLFYDRRVCGCRTDPSGAPILPMEVQECVQMRDALVVLVESMVLPPNSLDAL